MPAPPDSYISLRKKCSCLYTESLCRMRQVIAFIHTEGHGWPAYNKSSQSDRKRVSDDKHLVLEEKRCVVYDARCIRRFGTLSNRWRNQACFFVKGGVKGRFMNGCRRFPAGRAYRQLFSKRALHGNNLWRVLPAFGLRIERRGFGEEIMAQNRNEKEKRYLYNTPERSRYVVFVRYRHTASYTERFSKCSITVNFITKFFNNVFVMRLLLTCLTTASFSVPCNLRRTRKSLNSGACPSNIVNGSLKKKDFCWHGLTIIVNLL